MSDLRLPACSWGLCRCSWFQSWCLVFECNAGSTGSRNPASSTWQSGFCLHSLPLCSTHTALTGDKHRNTKLFGIWYTGSKYKGVAYDWSHKYKNNRKTNIQTNKKHKTKQQHRHKENTSCKEANTLKQHLKLRKMENVFVQNLKNFTDS